MEPEEMARDQLGEIQQKARETWSSFTEVLQVCVYRALPCFAPEQQEELSLHAFIRAF